MSIPSMKLHAFILCGLGYGDEGKGTVTDFLTRRYDAKLVVRYNGGPQAAHNVVTRDGRHHCFAQFGSGMLVPGVSTYLAALMFIDPIAMVNENTILATKGVNDAMKRLFIHRDCPIITPYHQYLNRIEEMAKGAHLHGSCGMGVGQAFLDLQSSRTPMLRLGDVDQLGKSREILTELRQQKIARAEQLVDANPAHRSMEEQFRRLHSSPDGHALAAFYRDFVALSGVHRVDDEKTLLKSYGEATIIFEGAQGVLLDMDYGFWPHVTPSNTTPKAASSMADQYLPRHKVHTLGVTRSFATRHGHGPFVTQDQALTTALKDPYNPENPWQGMLRCGWLDLPALSYAIEVAKTIDALVITNLDRLGSVGNVKLCRAYRVDTPDAGYYFFKNNGTKEGHYNRIKIMGDCKYRIGLTSQLKKSRPLYTFVDGWPPIQDTRKSIHPKLRAFLEVLQTSEGLALPVDCVSIGPCAEDKQWLA